MDYTDRALKRNNIHHCLADNGQTRIGVLTAYQCLDCLKVVQSKIDVFSCDDCKGQVNRAPASMQSS